MFFFCCSISSRRSQSCCTSTDNLYGSASFEACEASSRQSEADDGVGVGVGSPSFCISCSFRPNPCSVSRSFLRRLLNSSQDYAVVTGGIPFSLDAFAKQWRKARLPDESQGYWLRSTSCTVRNRLGGTFPIDCLAVVRARFQYSKAGRKRMHIKRVIGWLPFFKSSITSSEVAWHLQSYREYCSFSGIDRS